jgi:hypothetical protein
MTRVGSQRHSKRKKKKVVIKGWQHTQVTAISEGFARAFLCICPFIEPREQQQLTSNPASIAAALIVHFAYLWPV